MVSAIQVAQREIVRIIGLIEEFRKKAGLSDKSPYSAAPDNPLKAIFRQKIYDEFRTAKLTSGKGARADAINDLKDRVVPPRTAARELGVAYVLTGSVRRAGNRARISIQLEIGRASCRERV